MQSQILVGRPSEPVFPPPALDGLYRFRHRVFHQRLGWEVSSARGREMDEYDDLDPVYIAYRRGAEEVIGTFRLLHTTGPYMLRDVFPQLLRGEPLPCASDVWELSRFAVEPEDPSARVQASCSATTLSLMRACYRYGVDNGIREYVMATSVAVERMLRGLGLNLVRFGDGKAVRIGRVLSVACRLSIDDALGRALGVRGADVAEGEVRKEVA